MGELKRLQGHVWRAIRSMGIEPQVRAQVVVRKWPEVVGELLARVSSAQRLRSGLLWVVAENSAWCQELSLRREFLRERLNQAVGEELVREIRVRVGNPRRPAQPAPAEQRWEPFVSRDRPRDPDSALAELASAIKAARERLGREGGSRCARCGALHGAKGELCPVCRFSSGV
jgi:hypothetical protein